uniref:Uncharacterized protein n=1 Tax=Sphaerodactylus townsendi TaxID=933632 RepID=A0ACB8ER32_9SAUR
MADPSEKTLPVTWQIHRQSALQNIVDEPVELRDAYSCLVVDAAGKEMPFGALYEQQKTILVFVRHFLCYACKEYVEDLGKISKDFLQDANVRLVVIGQSSHHHIKILKGKFIELWHEKRCLSITSVQKSPSCQIQFAIRKH